MIVLDHPPAIIIQRAITPFRFIVNDGKEHDCGPCLPRDFTEMPRALRWALASEAKLYLPEPYRRLSDGMLREMLGSIGGLPGVLMAGGIKTAWLYTANGTFSVPGYWTDDDNAIHAVGAGGNGRAPTLSGLVPDNYYGGPGGGGSAWAAADDAVLVPFSSYNVVAGTSHGDDSSFDTLVIAKGGSDGGNISGGSGSGGSGGSAASSTGNRKSNGGNGQGVSGFSPNPIGAPGGGAGGPHGDGKAGAAGGDGDAGYGGHGGLLGTDSADLSYHEGQDGVDGPAGGWNPGNKPNAGSGGGGGRGNGASGGSGYDPNGKAGGLYGAGGGGAGVVTVLVQTLGTAGLFSPGCVLIINNASL